ncbi:MAG: inositol monophosphatase family protein [Candidatus Komeilibacteria bacterium]
MKLSPRAKLTLATAEEAGRILLSEAKRIRHDKVGQQNISIKNDLTPGKIDLVTSVDKLLDSYITKQLKQKYPNDFFLTEESYVATADRLRLTHKSVWIIDPIDGTRDFSQFLLGEAKKRRQHSFSICLAWAKKGILQIGAIYTPVLSEIWVAEKGRGTWYKKGNSQWRKLIMQPKKSARLTIALNSHERVTHENTPQLAGHKFVFPSSLAYRIVGTTTGHHDMLISFKGGSKEWDVAAADIILQEAGGLLLDADKKMIRYNKPDLVNHLLLIAGHPKNIDRLLPLIQKKSLALIGSISHSTPLYPDGVRERFGGGVIYGSETAKKLGLDVHVITAGANDIEGGIKQLRKQQIWSVRLKRKLSNNFANDCTKPKRILRMGSIMERPITKRELTKHIPNADGWILNPIYHEVSPDMVPAKRNFVVYMDIQGLTRAVTRASDGYWHLKDHKWPGWKQWKGKLDILRLSDEDAEHMAFPAKCKNLKSRLHYLVTQGFPIVVASQGTKPTLVATKKGIKEIPVTKVDAVDTGGAGDSFNAGFMAGYLTYKDPIVAAAFGNAAAGLMVSGKGTTNCGNWQQVETKAKLILKKINYAL